MKVTNEELYIAVIGNEDAPMPLGSLIKKELPISTAAKLVRLSEKLKPEIAAITQVRDELVRKYGAPSNGAGISVRREIDILGEDGKPIGKEANPNWELFVSDFNELLRQEIELDLGKDWAKVPLPVEILEKKGVFVSGLALIALDKFVEAV